MQYKGGAAVTQMAWMSSSSICKGIAICFLIFTSLVEHTQSQHSACASDNYAGPLVAPFRNVTVRDVVISRGVAVEVGSREDNTPSEMAFEINSNMNLTYIYENTGTPKGHCERGPWWDVTCESYRGGLLDRSSKGWRTLPTASPDAAGSPNTAGTDTFKIGGAVLDSINVTLLDQSLTQMNSLGLGPASQLLESLKQTRRIASRSYSYWSGWRGAEARYQAEGSLVLGGIDRARILAGSTEKKVNMTIVDGCPSGMVASVSRMMMGLANGSVSPILEDSVGTRFCIMLEERFIAVPPSSFVSFTDVAGSPTGDSRTPDQGVLYNINDAYTGNLSITLNGGLTITIPSHQLSIPELFTDKQGAPLPNGSKRMFLMRAATPGFMPLLGNVFLTSAYISINHESKSFSLWEAATAATQASNIEEIVSEGWTCDTVTPSSSNDLAAGGNASRSPLSGGVIAGATIGAVGAAGLLVVSIFWLCRRNRRRSNDEKSLLDQNTTKPASTPRPAASASSVENASSSPVEPSSSSTWPPPTGAITYYAPQPAHIAQIPHHQQTVAYLPPGMYDQRWHQQQLPPLATTAQAYPPGQEPLPPTWSSTMRSTDSGDAGGRESEEGRCELSPYPNEKAEAEDLAWRRTGTLHRRAELPS